VDQFRTPNDRLQIFSKNEQIAMYPFTVAELALGSLSQRAVQRKAPDDLPVVSVAQLDEVRRMIEAHSLYSTGIGLVDAHLIASCLIHPPTLRQTADKRLSNAAESLGIAAGLS
jgi:predicted nucleic acid-binding protein